MSASEPIYMRLPTDLKEEVSRFAEESGLQLTDAYGELMRRGLDAVEMDRKLADSQAHLAKLRDENTSFEIRGKEMEGPLTLTNRELAIAQQARAQLPELERPKPVREFAVRRSRTVLVV